MNTTTLLVDILIIGIQVLVWKSVFLFSFLFSVKDLISLSEKTPTVFILIIITISYTLGIVFDYIIANFFSKFKSKEEKEIHRTGITINILNFDKEIHKFLDSQYARLRIARATVFNLPLITISICTYILSNNKQIDTKVCTALFFVLLIGFILTIFSYYGWKSRNKVYWGYIKNTLSLLDNIKNKS